jgi:ubiquinone/menaquinone biosynthesis C-methylase UbiE
MAVLLARRDFRVQAMDVSTAMLDLTRRHAAEAGVCSRLSLSTGDVHALAFKDNAFSLVVALGVIPWVHDPEQALREMARSLQPGGYLIVSADNRYRLNHLVDPLYNPALRSIRRVGGQLFDKMGWRRPAAKGAPVQMHDLRSFDRFIEAIGLEPIRTMTFGFGPISLMGREVLPQAIGVKINQALQGLADHGLPGIRSAGSQYLVVARKPPT